MSDVKVKIESNVTVTISGATLRKLSVFLGERTYKELEKAGLHSLWNEMDNHLSQIEP